MGFNGPEEGTKDSALGSALEEEPLKGKRRRRRREWAEDKGQGKAEQNGAKGEEGEEEGRRDMRDGVVHTWAYEGKLSVISRKQYQRYKFMS